MGRSQVHPALVREGRLRRRFERIGRGVAVAMGLAGVAGLGAAVSIRAGSPAVLLDVGFLVPVAVLILLAGGFVLAGRWAGRERILLEAGELSIVSAGRPVRGVRLSEVERTVVLERPVGVSLVLSGPSVVSVPLGWVLGKPSRSRQLEVLQVPGLEERLRVVPSPSEYEKLVSSRPEPGSADDERLLDCHRVLGCWRLATAQMLARWNGGLVDEPCSFLRDLWEAARSSLGLSGRYRFLELAEPVLGGPMRWERLRMALGLGFRREAEEILAGEASGTDLPLEAWRRALASGPAFRSRWTAALETGSCRLTSAGVDLGQGRLLPFWAVVLVVVRHGALGPRSVDLFDCWGQRHHVSASRLPGGADLWVCDLRIRAPHVLEVAEDRFGSSRGVLRTARQAVRLVREAGKVCT